MTDYQYEVTSLPVDETLFYRRADVVQRLRFLIRYAQLASSTYNSQPWLFNIQPPQQIWVYANPRRWLKIADPDKREMHISIGCAIENVLTAAQHYNFTYQIDYLPDRLQPALMAIIHLKPGNGEPGLTDAALMQAMTQRRTWRRQFLAEPLQASHWALLESCCVDGLSMLTTRQSTRFRDKIAELTPLAYQVLFGDRAWRREHALRVALSNSRWRGRWVRLKHMLRGLLTNPAKTYSERDQRYIEKAPGVIVIGAAEDTMLTRLQCGQMLQRMLLIATTLGIGVQPMCQVLEIPELRSELKNIIGRKQFQPLMICRLGYTQGAVNGRALRNRLDDVLI